MATTADDMGRKTDTGADAGGNTDADTPTEIAVVREFLDALQRADFDAAMALLHPAISYQNVPFPPYVGLAKVEPLFRGMERFKLGFEVEHHNIAANGPVVLTERTDVLIVGGVRGAFWVCGTFEVHDGLITVWRDRFDFVDFTLSFIRGGVLKLLQAVTGGGSGSR